MVKMHLDSLLQPSFISEALPPDQSAYVSPICSPIKPEINTSNYNCSDIQWLQQQQIMDTLDEAFHKSCNNSLPSNTFDYYSESRLPISRPNLNLPTNTHYNNFLNYETLHEEFPSNSQFEDYHSQFSTLSNRTPEPIVNDSLSQCIIPDITPKEELMQESFKSMFCLWVNCGEEFHNQGSLVDHVNSVHMEVKKGCEELPCLWKDCPRQLKPFNAKYKLLTHMRVHTREKPYKCNFLNCDRAFARLENKKIHYRSHTGHKPFSCKFAKDFNCLKKFSNSSDRAKHEQTHKDPKPYRCEVTGCSKRYTDPSSLRKHVKSHSVEEQCQYRKFKDIANNSKKNSSPTKSITSPESPLSFVPIQQIWCPTSPSQDPILLEDPRSFEHFIQSPNYSQSLISKHPHPNDLDVIMNIGDLNIQNKDNINQEDSKQIDCIPFRHNISGHTCDLIPYW